MPGSGGSGDEFLTYDSVRSILTKMALGGPGPRKYPIAKSRSRSRSRTKVNELAPEP